ncbi:putative disease resistance protein RGA4 isoform X1 [Quercus suber]|uniref:putative disease resistance protein RGA4 isoform X1 n=1 Tax=Quercus suber TaxID=58331 RepID=UPI000CE26E49|nr:putative disease resistance protein RGA4 [Quercus suber]
MAEGALFYLAGKVLQLLGSIIAEEVKLASSVKTEIEDLTNTVSTIHAVILDAEKQSSQSHQIEDWLKKLKDVLHDADDLLDDFSTEVMRHKVMTKKVCIFSSSSNLIAFSPKLGREIKAIRERLNAIAKDKGDFHFSKGLVEPQVMNKGGRETHSFVLEGEVIGRENDKKEIMERLFDDNVVENISIIPIVGIGGLGKTTLAQLVYNDENVQTKFDIKLWVCISDIFDVKRIVKEILEQLPGSKNEQSLQMLQTQLREKLNEKKYLLVLDDLWNEDNNKWLLLRNLLMGGARGSRIIVTTRSESVARIIGATSWHALRGLPKEKAWSLFVKVALEQVQLPENQAFISLGEEIVEKCGGVPLAIRTIASLLRTKASENEWRSFKDYELSKITQEEKNGISSTLKLSYDHLPSHLKQCFAYCRLFPKDYKINVETLFNLWAAQGFIKLSNPKQRVEDVGREYFMVLLWRCFFQDVEKDKCGNISYCKMHDLMHDLATLVAGMESTMLTSSEEYNGKKVRHVSFDFENSLRKTSIFKVEGMKIRTILIASVGGKLGNLTCDALVSNLNYLRTLDLSELNLCVVPHSIGELKHLRYLDLSKNKNIVFLPISITKLLNLLTLKLSGCHSLKELPWGLEKLVNLRHLDFSNCNKMMHMPLGLGHLISLEILPLFSARQEGLKATPSSWFKKKQARSGGGLSELKQLNNLGGSLVIKNLGHGKDDMVECNATDMKEKQYLQELQLWWDDGESECYDEMSLEGLQPHPNLKMLRLSHYMGMRIPSWVSSLNNLVHFELYKNRRLQHLPSLNQLPFLKSVFLYEMEALEYIWIGEDNVSNMLGGSSFTSSSKTAFFPSLSSLVLMDCPNLKGWWRNSGDDDNEPHHLLLPSFPPSLFHLQIGRCPNLTYMPLIPDLTLKGSIIYGCPLLVLRQRGKE